MIKTITSTILAAVLTTTGCASTNHIPTPHPKGYETFINAGETFKHQNFTNIKNEPISLSQKRKLVIFFATWCDDSQRLLKQLKNSKLINDDKLQIIGIGREEDNNSLTSFNKEYQLPFDLISDPKRQIYQTYANKGVPRLILLDNKNRVVKTLIGERIDILDEVTW